MQVILTVAYWIYLDILKGGGHLKPPKFEHVFVAVITFSPFLLCK